MHAWPADAVLRRAAVNGEAEGAKEGVLGRFHEAEEVGKVHDPSGIGIGKFHQAGVFEFVRHIRILQGNRPMAAKVARTSTRSGKLNFKSCAVARPMAERGIIRPPSTAKCSFH